MGIVGGGGKRSEFVKEDSFGPVRAFKKYEKTTPSIVKYYTERYPNNWEPKPDRAKQTGGAAGGAAGSRRRVKSLSSKKQGLTEGEFLNKALREKVKLFLIRLR